MRGVWWILALAVGCGGKDTAAPVDEGFAEQSVVGSLYFDQCNLDGGTDVVFWPEDRFPVLIDGIPLAQAPPYEIREVRVFLLHGPGIGCDAASGARVQVWVSQQQPDRLAPSTDGVLPEFPALVDVELAAAEVDGDEYHEAVATIDPPVRVEEAGTLWIGMVSPEPPGTTPVACLAGCSDVGQTVYQWTELEGWVGPQTSLPLFRVTIGHD